MGRKQLPENMEYRKQLAKRAVEGINNDIAQNDRPLQKKYYERYKACFICLHNEDKAGFGKWTTKLIATAHKLIGDLEADCNNLDLTIVNDKSEKTIHIKEDAYNEMCKLIERELKTLEMAALVQFSPQCADSLKVASIYFSACREARYA